MNGLNEQQTAHLVALLAALRPDWDRPGIRDALNRARAQNRADAFTLTVAAIRCASTSKNRTPAVIPLDGAHWREPSSNARLEPPTHIPDRFDAATLAADRARASTKHDDWVAEIRGILNTRFGDEAESNAEAK